MSIGLFALYVATNVLEKITGGVIIHLISMTISTFLASPFKTIFSIPALLLRQPEATQKKPIS